MRTNLINLDELFYSNEEENRKLLITNPESLDKNKKYSEDGLFSEKIFGTMNDSDILTSYSCKCGNLQGKFLLNETCPVCGEDVIYRKSSFEKIGWIDLGKYYIINPVFYYLLSKLAGSSIKLNDIINYDKKLNKNGLVIDEDSENFNNIGLIEFKENLFDGACILNSLYKNCKNKNKTEIYQLIVENKDKVFISKIPVTPPTYRPCTLMMTKDKPIFKFDEINKYYNFIIKFSNLINKRKGDNLLYILPNLYKIQTNMNNIFNKIIETISSKEGFIRSNILGNRLNYTGRCVMTPLPPGHQIDDILIPYLSFIEIYKLQLINMLSKVKDISLLTASKIIDEAQANFNEEVYNLAVELCEKTEGGLFTLGIRNPTIGRGSELGLKIMVKKDFNDLTVSVHNCILELIAGDYDGDVFNICPIFDNEIKTKFNRTFNPTNMFISNNTGIFNEKLSLDRDQIIGIYQFNK